MPKVNQTFNKSWDAFTVYYQLFKPVPYINSVINSVPQVAGTMKPSKHLAQVCQGRPDSKHYIPLYSVMSQKCIYLNAQLYL